MTFKPGMIWITGLSAAGKTTLAERLTDDLKRQGLEDVVLLDGEAVRDHLRLLGYSEDDRREIAFRKAEIARKYNDAGMAVIVTGITAQRVTRQQIRRNVGRFMEVYLNCPVEVCAKRDYKGHYKKALDGTIADFVGVSMAYEVSDHPELTLDTAEQSVDECAHILLRHAMRFLGTPDAAREVGAKTKSQRLRSLFAGGGVIRIVGAHNGMTARLVEQAGFEGVWASGLEVSTSHAVPDANILTMTDYLRAAVDMNDATSIPVIVDADTGYGNANNVIHMVRKFEREGIAAVCIEDKVFPKVNSYIPGRQELAPISEVAGKIMGGKDAQATREFMLFARVEALVAGWGMEEALKRASAYVEAGADGIFIHSKAKNAAEIRAFVEAWDSASPLIVCPTSYPDLTVQEARSLGKVKVVIFANHGIRAAIKAIKETFSTLVRTGDLRTIQPVIAPMDEVFQIQGMLQLKESEKSYVRTAAEPVRAIIPAAGRSHEPSLERVLQGRPVAMLEIHGKPILQRHVEILNALRIQDICVITGHRRETVDVGGIRKIHNADYADTHILDSIMAAEDMLDGRTLVVYSDVLAEKDVLEKLLECDDDMVLAVDSSYRETAGRQDKLQGGDVVLVKAEHPPVEGRRVIRSGRANYVVRIGKHLDPREAQFEYVGLALFSKKGIQAFRQAYHRERAAWTGGAFNEAESFQKANLFDLLQKMIAAGQRVRAFEIHKGWTEIHTLADYERVLELVVA